MIGQCQPDTTALRQALEYITRRANQYGTDDSSALDIVYEIDRIARAALSGGEAVALPVPTDTVRAVALAICKSRTCEGVSCCQWPANMGRTNCNAKNGAYDDAARAAIAVLSSDVAVAPANPVAWRAYCSKTGGQMVRIAKLKDWLIEDADRLYAEHGYILQPLYAALPSEAIGREEAARIIYDAFPFDGDSIEKRKPGWVDGGNSIMQDRARRAADAVLAVSRPTSLSPDPRVDRVTIKPDSAADVGGPTK